MSMSRKDFVVLAESFRLTQPLRGPDEGPFMFLIRHKAWRQVRDQVIYDLDRKYDNFRPELFRAATEQAREVT